MTWNADLAVGLVGLLRREDAVGEAFQITSDEVLTWDRITAEIGHAAGVEPSIVHVPIDLIAAYDAETASGMLGDKTHSVVFDNTKIKRFVPGFGCRVPFSEGIRRSIAWFDADPARRTMNKAAGGPGTPSSTGTCGRSRPVRNSVYPGSSPTTAGAARDGDRDERARDAGAHLAPRPGRSIAKAERLMGYRPRYSSLEAVREAVNWLIADGQVRVPS